MFLSAWLQPQGPGDAPVDMGAAQPYAMVGTGAQQVYDGVDEQAGDALNGFASVDVDI